jgi:hypothetical protein
MKKKVFIKHETMRLTDDKNKLFCIYIILIGSCWAAADQLLLKNASLQPLALHEATKLLMRLVSYEPPQHGRHIRRQLRCIYCFKSLW